MLVYAGRAAYQDEFTAIPSGLAYDEPDNDACRNAGIPTTAAGRGCGNAAASRMAKSNNVE